jgi:hypothetical protein
MKGFIVPAILLVLLFIGIVTVAGVNFVGIANIFTGASIVSNGQTCTAKTGLSVIPIMGYYQCRPIGDTYIDVEIPNSGFLDFGTEFKVQCDKFATMCTGTLLEVTSGTNCASGSCKTLSSSTINRGDYFTISELPIGHRFLRLSFSPYSLWLESRTGNSGWINSNQYGCNLPYGKDYCLGGLLCDSNKLYKSGTLDFDQASNFLEQWAVSPSEFSTVKYNGADAYCSGDGNIYSFSTIQLTSGCYAYPNSIIGKVDCCPKQIFGSAVCGDDFKFHSSSDTQSCISDIECGGGTYSADYTDASRKTLIARKCVNFKCESQIKYVECSTNEACATGLVCMIDSYAGTGKCVGSDTPQTSPRVPTVIGAGWSIVDWLINIITALIIGAIITVLLYAVWLFVLPIRFLIPILGTLKNPRNFAISTIIIAVIVLILFTGLVLMTRGSIFGG